MHLRPNFVFGHYLEVAARPAGAQRRCQGMTEQVLVLPHFEPHLAAKLPGMTAAALALPVSWVPAPGLHEDLTSMALHVRTMQTDLHHVPAEATERLLSSLAVDLSSRGEAVAWMPT